MQRRVLIVDDNVDLLESLDEMLCELCEVRVARNADEALALADGVDVVLLDLVLGKVDAVGLVAKFTERGTSSIVLMSGRADLEEVARRAGTTWLPKPFSAVELTRVLGIQASAPDGYP